MREAGFHPFGGRVSKHFGDSLSPDDAYLSYYDIRLMKEDIDTLRNDWLTDNVISFWQEYLEREYLNQYKNANIVLLRPSMSFMLMQTPNPLTLKEALPNFTRTTHIFLPINNCHNPNLAEGGSHWSLLLVSIVDGVAFHYDSLNPANRNEALHATNKLQQLLGKGLQFIDLADSPQQHNSSDCGVFVCFEMRYLLLRKLLQAPANQKVSMSMGSKSVDASHGRKDMLRIIEGFRKEGERRRSIFIPTSGQSSAYTHHLNTEGYQHPTEVQQLPALGAAPARIPPMFGVLRPGSPERDRIPVSSDGSPPPPRSLAPMPPAEFRSREELLTGCKDWAASQGYAVVIARSRLNRLWLKCDRGGVYENRRNLTPDQRKRKRGDSRLLGCPFKMLATCKKDNIWRVETDIADHNHGPSDDLSAHPTLRRMTDEQVQKVHDMCDAGKSPAETLEELKAIWPDIKVLTRDIYNARKKYKTEKEEAALAAGLPEEQPWQDPNEMGLPGPNPHGRWAWVPDGEEVTNKRTKKKKRTAPASNPLSTPVSAAQSTLDPQLQTPDTSHTLRQSISAAGQQLLDEFSRHPQLAYGRYDSAPNTLEHHASTNGNGDHSDFYQNTDDNAHQYPEPPYPSPHQNTTPSRLRSSRPLAPTATMSANQTAVDNNAVNTASGASKAPSGQVLMSRIERMEKEQRDQKNMLAQILGAVQGIHNSPNSL